jgi:hypothetical protein
VAFSREVDSTFNRFPVGEETTLEFSKDMLVGFWFSSFGQVAGAFRASCCPVALLIKDLRNFQPSYLKRCLTVSKDDSEKAFDFTYVENFLTGIQDSISKSLQKDKFRVADPIEITLRAVVTEGKRGFRVSVVQLDQKVEAYHVSEIVIRLNRIAENEPMRVHIR